MLDTMSAVKDLCVKVKSELLKKLTPNCSGPKYLILISL